MASSGETSLRALSELIGLRQAGAFRGLRRRAIPSAISFGSPAVVRVAVMMHIRHPLSLRQVEDPLFERGIDICHEMARFS
jgi:hypothetical protein